MGCIDIVKDHEYAKIINNLRDKAVLHKDCQSMREALSGAVRPLITENKCLQDEVDRLNQYIAMLEAIA